MGPQSCGKSTLAKIISFCTWMEKTNAFEEKMAFAVVSQIVRFLF